MDIIDYLTSLYKKNELTLFDIEFARYIRKIEKNYPNELGLIGAIVNYFHQKGHICVSLDDILSNNFFLEVYANSISKSELIAILSKATTVGNPNDLTLFILEDENLYLQKFWKFENELSQWLITKSLKTASIQEHSLTEIDHLFDQSSEINWQKIASKIALVKDLLIITGGPGTGKTFTVNKILEVLQFNRIKSLKIALAAPTGKASQRLNESLHSADETIVSVTLHKLLGAKGDSGTYYYNENNKLPYDVVVVDEASMLDINLWIRLIRALSDTTKLILLGDKNQLASVEAGSILGDICSKSSNTFSRTISHLIGEVIPVSDVDFFINDCIIQLTKSYRFKEDSGIKKLSEAINNGDSDEVLALLSSDKHNEINVNLFSKDSIEEVVKDYAVDPLQNVINSEFDKDLIKSHKIVCALRKGPFGVEEINKQSELILKKKLGIPSSQVWYNGRPIIINKNSRLLKIKNGETGFVKRNASDDYYLQLDGDERTPILISRLQDYESAFAITIHKSQGSEYDHIVVMLSNSTNRLLSREILYTAVTRARKSVLIIASNEIIKETVEKRILRNSGLSKKIWN